MADRSVPGTVMKFSERMKRFAPTKLQTLLQSEGKLFKRMADGHGRLDGGEMGGTWMANNYDF